MSDIVDRLRHCSENSSDEYLHELAGRAAYEIEWLRAALMAIATSHYGHETMQSIARAALDETSDDEKPRHSTDATQKTDDIDVTEYDKTRWD